MKEIKMSRKQERPTRLSEDGKHYLVVVKKRVGAKIVLSIAEIPVKFCPICGNRIQIKNKCKNEYLHLKTCGEIECVRAQGQLSRDKKEKFSADTPEQKKKKLETVRKMKEAAKELSKLSFRGFQKY